MTQLQGIQKRQKKGAKQPTGDILNEEICNRSLWTLKLWLHPENKELYI